MPRITPFLCNCLQSITTLHSNCTIETSVALLDVYRGDARRAVESGKLFFKIYGTIQMTFIPL